MSNTTWIITSDDDWPTHAKRGDIDGARVFSTSFLLQQDLARDGRAVELWEDHFPSNGLRGLYGTVIDYAEHWHLKIDRPEFAVQLEFDGIDLASLMDYAACFVFSELMHNIEIIEALLATATPSRVVAGDPRRVTARLWRDACEMRSIPFESGAEHPDRRPAEPHKHTPNPIKGWREVWDFHGDLGDYRRTDRPMRILARRARYSVPIVNANEERLACLFYEGGKMAEFLRFASVFNGKLRRAGRRARKKTRQLRQLYADLAEMPVLDYRGYNLWPYLRMYLDRVFGHAEGGQEVLFDNRFGVVVQMSLPELLNDILYAQTYLDAGRPDAVIVAQDSWGLDRAFVACARPAGVPTVVLQHGIPAAYYPIRADRMFMWGDYGARFFCEAGGTFKHSLDVDETCRRQASACPPMAGPTQTVDRGTREKAVITGNPELDAPQEYTKVRTPPDELRRQMGIVEGEKAVLFVGQPYVGLTAGDSPVYWEKQTSAIMTAVSQIDNCRLVLRPHPTESNGIYEAVARRVGAADCIFGRQSDLVSLINACDLTVVWNSTVSLDALMLGKRVLILDLYGYDTGIPFGELGGIPEVRRADDLGDAIKEALASEPDPERVRRFLDDQLYRGDLPPTQMAYERLRELVEGTG